MRTAVAALGGITVLFIGGFAISESAQQSKDTAMNSGSAGSDAWNMGVDVFGNVQGSGGQGIVWFGIAAVILVSLGFLVAAASSGGR